MKENELKMSEIPNAFFLKTGIPFFYSRIIEKKIDGLSFQDVKPVQKSVKYMQCFETKSKLDLKLFTKS